MRTVLIVLLLLCSCARSQIPDTQRKAISHDLRVQIDETWKQIQYYDYMMGLWQRDQITIISVADVRTLLAGGRCSPFPFSDDARSSIEE